MFPFFVRTGIHTANQMLTSHVDVGSYILSFEFYQLKSNLYSDDHQSVNSMKLKGKKQVKRVSRVFRLTES